MLKQPVSLCNFIFKVSAKMEKKKSLYNSTFGILVEYTSKSFIWKLDLPLAVAFLYVTSYCRLFELFPGTMRAEKNYSDDYSDDDANV